MQRLPKTSARLFFKNVNIICPDQEAYKRCCNFKITSSSNPSASARQLDCALSDLSPLSGHFSREAQASLLDKAKTVLYNDQFRQGFKASVYFLDCKGPTPHRVQRFKGGKCTCDCMKQPLSPLPCYCVSSKLCGKQDISSFCSEECWREEHPGSGLYLHRKLQPTIHQIQIHRIQGQISKLKLWIQQLLNSCNKKRKTTSGSTTLWSFGSQKDCW